MGWFSDSKKSAPSSGKEMVAMANVNINPDYVYYLGEDGNVWRKNEASNEIVANVGVTKEDEYLYFIDTAGGNVFRIHQSGNFDVLDGAEHKSLSETNPLATSDDIGLSPMERAILNAKKREEYYDYDGAIEIYEKLIMPEEAARIRKLKIEENTVKVDQTVVQGDYIDDRDTIVKDSVINRSNVGTGGKSKVEEIKEIKELLDSGAIDDGEFNQMKKEILGK